MFIPLKMVLIGIDPYPCVFSGSQKLQVPHLPAPFCCGAPGPGEFSTSSGARVKSPSNFMHFRKENEHQPLKKGGYLLFLQLILLQEKHILLQDPMLCQELEMLLMMMMMMMMMVTYDDGNGDDDSWVMIHDCGLLDWSWEVLDFPLKNSKQNLNAGWLTVPWGWQTSYSPNGISFVWAPSKNHWCWHYSVRGNNMDVSLRYQYIYIYDIDSNLRCPTTKKCLWYMNVPIYGNILTYSSIYTSKGYPETLVASC